MKTLTGIEAAWMEKDGLGSFSVSGRKVTFTGKDGYSASWSLATTKLADTQLRLFRAATKYPETRSAA